MYAIVDIAGQQFKVEKDQKLYVHRLEGEEGKKVSFDKVYLIQTDKSVSVGDPVVKGASVSAKILEHVKGDKVLVFKKKRRKGYQKMNGHRQYFTQIVIESISEKPAKAAPKAEEEQKPAAAAKKTTESKSAAAPKEDKKAPAASKAAESKSSAPKSTAAKKTTSKETATTKKPSGTKKTAAKKESASKSTAKGKTTASASGQTAKKSGTTKKSEPGKSEDDK